MPTEVNTVSNGKPHSDGFVARIVRVWGALPHERRLAAGACLVLVLTLFLPWYQETVIDLAKSNRLLNASDSVTGWGAFSFVEAAVLLVAGGVLTLLFQRAEGRAFHLPGGDGWAVTIAGAWTSCLIIWRIFDKQGATSHRTLATTWGIEWGIFVALAVAVGLTYAGNRIRAAHSPEPPLPGEPAGSAEGIAPAAPPRVRARTPAPPTSAAAARAAKREARRSKQRSQVAPPTEPTQSAPPATAPTRSAPPATAATQSAPPAAAPPEPAPVPRRVRRAPGAPAVPASPSDDRPVGWLTASKDSVSTEGSGPPRVLPSPPGWSHSEEKGAADEPATADETTALPASPRRRRPPASDEQLTIRLDDDGN